MSGKTTLLAVVAALCAAPAFAQAPPTTPPAGGPPAAAPARPQGPAVNSPETSWIRRQYRDVRYAPLSPAQALDIYLPNEGDGPFPVIVAVHGGAFMMGDKADGQLAAPLEGVRRGYAVVSVNYRLSGEATFPAAVQDVKSAVRFLRANAARYGLDGSRIAAWGGSAGGHLVSMLGTTGRARRFDDPAAGNASQSSAVQAVVDWFGPIFFDRMDAQFAAGKKGRPDHGAAGSPESRFLGKAVADAPALAADASPATYLDKDAPPFFVEHGDADPLVPTEQSIQFVAAIRAAAGNDRAVLTILPGAGHGGPQFVTPANLDLVFAFLDKALRR